MIPLRIEKINKTKIPQNEIQNKFSIKNSKNSFIGFKMGRLSSLIYKVLNKCEERIHKT